MAYSCDEDADGRRRDDSCWYSYSVNVAGLSCGGRRWPTDGVEIMAQRKKAPKSQPKERTKARLTSSRSRGALNDPEYLGADVDALVSQRMVGAAKRQLGAVPQFWGRYFKGPGDQNPVRYQAQIEGPVLRANNIRVLPIAQQTNHVDGDRPLGSQDGLRNAAAIIAQRGVLSRMERRSDRRRNE
jgi:hypothetical protein